MFGVKLCNTYGIGAQDHRKLRNCNRLANFQLEGDCDCLTWLFVDRVFPQWAQGLLQHYLKMLFEYINVGYFKAQGLLKKVGLQIGVGILNKC